MSSTRLTLKEIELTPDGILIRSVEIIDSISGETIRPANLNQELCDLIKIIEIDIDAFFEVQKAKEKNENFTKLVDTFKLYT